MRRLVDAIAGLGGLDAGARVCLFCDVSGPDALDAARDAYRSRNGRWPGLFSVEGVTPQLHTPDEAQQATKATRAVTAERDAASKAEHDAGVEEHKARLRRARGFPERTSA